ncbi:MAG: SusD/RagB family nutrient-binding outer membrane lipoprotein, partial [Bacteroidota bacterium]
QALDGDLLYGGDLNAWIKFANSLKIKALMRISDVQNVANDLNEIYTEGNFISANLENATFDFTDGQPNNFRMATLRDGDFNLFILSETMEEILNRNADPRISVLFRPYANAPNGTEFAGLLNGPDASQTSISVADYSLSGTIFRDHTGDLDANFITAWETHLLLAEAAEKGLIGGNAQTHYEEGVRLAFEYWHTELPANYLTTDSAAYGSFGQDPIEQIITQKWVANIINGYEGWIEYRRTGFPQLKTISASLNNDLIPVRMPYPTDEAALNAANFTAATTANQNSVNARVWWDAN